MGADARNDPKTFRFEFSTCSRVRHLAILFMIPPAKLKIEASQDKKNWITVEDWFTTSENSWSWYYYTKTFDPMLYAASMKVVL